MTITGSTRIYAIIGDPVAPLRSPALFNAAFARQGLVDRTIPIGEPPRTAPPESP